MTRGWAVAAPHHLATRAGAAVLADGGNAVDGALAAAAVLTVAYPHQCALGGDLVALVGLPDGTAHVVNGSGRAPRALDVAAVRRSHDRMPVDGPLTVTVPGLVDGWFTLAQRWGSRPLAGALHHAGRLAGDGVPVSPGLARALVEEAPRVAADAGLREVFLRDGAVLAEGATLVQPRLAGTLEQLADGGRDVLYDGPVGAALVATLRSHGSAITADDLAAHRTAVEDPGTLSVDGLTYLSSGGNTQGPFFLRGLRELAGGAAGPGSPDPLGPDAGRIATVLARAADARDRSFGDPLPQTDSGDTVAVVAADAAGTWVCLIQSVFHAFGAGLLDPQTGIVLHNRGAAFTLDPEGVGPPGSTSLGSTSLGPGRRPPHTLMPVLVRDAATGAFVGAHGTMGGFAQPQIQTHLALHLARGLTAQQAVCAPRWVVVPRRGEVARTALVEQPVPAVAREALHSKGFVVEDRPALDDEVGHAQVVRRAPLPADGFVAGSDPRADGEALTAP